MVDVGPLGGFAVRASFTEGSAYSNVTIGGGRACSDGTGPLVVVGLYGAISGRLATRTATMYLGGAAAALTIGAAGSAADTGWIATNHWLTYAVNLNYGYTSLSGSCYFGRGSNGTGFTQGAFGTFSGSVGMYYRYAECASAPTSVAVTPSADGTQATVTFGGPVDNGGSGISGYRIQRATNAGFTTGVSTIDAAGSGAVVTGLTPGVTYYFRVTARNGVTDPAGKLGGAWSAGVSSLMPDPAGAGKIAVSGVFVAGAGRRRNDANTLWEELEGRRRNAANTLWEEIGP